MSSLAEDTGFKLIEEGYTELEAYQLLAGLLDPVEEPLTAADWDPAEHPRDAEGQFTEKGDVSALTDYKIETDPGQDAGMAWFDARSKAYAQAKENRADFRAKGPIQDRIGLLVERWAGTSLQNIMKKEIKQGDWNDVLDAVANGVKAPTLYRGFSLKTKGLVKGHSGFQGDPMKFIESLQPGKEIDLGGLGSFTTSKTHAEHFGDVLFSMVDGRGLPIETISATPFEHEWLVTGKMRVVDVKKKGKKYLVNVTWVNDKSPADTALTAAYHILIAASDVHTGAMIALIPSDRDLQRLAFDGGEDAEQLHLTLAFLGDADDISDDARAEIEAIARRYAPEPVRANGFSLNVFNPTGDEPCVVMGVGNGDSSLEDLRSNVISALRGMGRFTLPEQHTPWIPHVTLAYTDDFKIISELAARTGPITFDKIRVAFAGENVDIPLGESLTAGFFKKNKSKFVEAEHPRGPDGKFIEDAGVTFDKMSPDLIKKINAIPKPSTIGTPRTDVTDFVQLTDDDVKNAQNQMFETAGRKWTFQQDNIMRQYTHNLYVEINATLRGDSRYATLGHAHSAETMQSAMMPSPLSFTTGRVTDGLGSLKVDSLKDLKNLIGTKIRDRAFLSTSFGAEPDYSFVGRKFSLEIEVPEGTPLAFVSTISTRPKEREVLLASGTVFEIINASELESGRYHIKLRVIPDPTEGGAR